MPEIQEPPDFQKQIGQTLLVLRQGNICFEDSDAIVNAANSSLLGGGGVDGAIHRAGGPQILEECQEIRARQGTCAPGDAVITSGGKLKAKWVVHAVGPVWRGGGSNEAAILASAYKRSLEEAANAGARSVSFPSISTGAYGYPVSEAAKVAISELANYLEKESGRFAEIRFVLFDSGTFEAYKNAAGSLP